MEAVFKSDIKAFCRRALDRLPLEERERERGRDIPYAFSLYALGEFFYLVAKRQGWLRQRNPVVLGVSGGSDSMALLWLFRTFFEGAIVVGHLEHGIRGGVSLEDAQYVVRTARNWGIETAVMQADVPGMLRQGESLETGGRRIRHAFLEAEAAKRGAFGVALAHHKGDVAETVLFNLLRGTGVRGSVGIPELRGVFFRPLLSCTREFLQEVLRCRGIEWREDCTNKDNRYTRNFIRNELMPLIKREINAQAVEHLAAFAEEMQECREEEERRGDVLLESAAMLAEGCLWSADRKKLSEHSVRERMLLLRSVGRRLEIPALSRKRSFELGHLMEGRKSFVFQWGGGISVVGDRERVSWIGHAEE